MNKTYLQFLVLMLSLGLTLFLLPGRNNNADTKASGSCGENLTWTLDDEGTLTITGTGEMGSWYTYRTPWRNYKGEIKKVIIDDGVTSISAYAFLDCSNLSDVEIPDSVTSIGIESFGSCTSLEEIVIPGSVKIIDGSFSNCINLKNVELSEGLLTIEAGAFMGCNSLQSITIPQGVSSIGDNAFSYCKSLQKITIPESVTSIGDSAFRDCSSLQNINIPESVTSIGDNAFSDCNSLQKITIPEGVTSIGDNAFMDCNLLKEITIPESVTSIGDSAFCGCKILQEIMIPESVTSIGDYAFESCKTLQEIMIPESVTSVGDSAFEGCYDLESVYISKKLYEELDIVNVFGECPNDIFTFYNCISFSNDGNGTVCTNRRDYKNNKVNLKLVPNENYEVDKVTWNDSAGNSKEVKYDGECYSFYAPDYDITVHATFKRVRANVTFCSEDGEEVLQSDMYDINAIPSYTKEFPVRESDDGIIYVFIGWSDGTTTYGVDDQLPAVTDDVTYTAVFEEFPQSMPPAVLYRVSSIEGEDKRSDIVFRINRSEDDENCISYFRSVEVDGTVLVNGTQYSAEKGSTVITLKSDYLKTLSAGEHNITVNFTDGTVTAAFNNLKRDAESIPATGETVIKGTIGVVLIVLACGVALIPSLKKKQMEK